MDNLEYILPFLIPFFPICRGYKDNRMKKNKRNEPPRIIVFGKINDLNTKTIKDSRGTKKFPLIEKILNEIANEHFPEFKFTNIQINYNVECLPHKDIKNKGDSIVFTVGNFTNGTLGTEEGDIDIYKKPYKFKGNLITHWTNPFEGDRFCIIFYSNKLQ